MLAGFAAAASRAFFAAVSARFVAFAASSSPTDSIAHRGQAQWKPQRFATAWRSGAGIVTSKYLTRISSPLAKSRAAWMNIVCPTRSLHALGAQLWLMKLGRGYTPTELAERIADVFTTFAAWRANTSWLGSSGRS